MSCDERERSDGDLHQPAFVALIDMATSLSLVFLLVGAALLVAARASSIVDRDDQVRNSLPKVILIPNELDGKVLFDSGQAEIRQEFIPVLNRFLEQILAAVPPGRSVQIQVQGHTDSRPLRATSDYSDNWELGAQRAVAVLRFLEGSGVKAELLSAASYGEHHPAQSGQSAEDLAANRRIQVTILDSGRTEEP